MRVPDLVLNCIGYLGHASPDVTGSNFTPFATAFFVTVKSGVQYGGKYWYVVTAKHAIDRLTRDWPYLATNVRGEDRVLLDAFVPEGGRHWYYHPTDKTADVAVTQLSSAPDLDLLPIPCSMFLPRPKLVQYGIGVGDEVFYPGLFEHVAGVEGEGRITPIVRTGAIAMFPREQVQVDIGDGRSHYMDVYLVESRSIGGLSGSPVFVRETATTCGKNCREARVLLHGVSHFHLLGLMTGHFDLTLDPPKINTGIAFVTPAEKILETLDQPDLLAVRGTHEQYLKDQCSTQT
jgi:hypothetical protein